MLVCVYCTDVTVQLQICKCSGPGQYHRPIQPTDGPAFTFGGRVREPAEQDELPGPGAYHVDLPVEGPAYTIKGRIASPGREREAAAMPGPGAYQPTEPGSPGGPAYTFGLRAPEPEAPPSPGPGAYDTLKALQQDQGPAYTMAGKAPIKGPEAEEVPGPGTYAPEALRDTGPAFTIGQRIYTKASTSG